MFFYKHYRHKDAGQYVHVDVPLCHAGDLNPHYTQHQHSDGPQHIHVDVQPEVSVRKKIQFCKNKQHKISRKSVCWESGDGTWRKKWNY